MTLPTLLFLAASIHPDGPPARQPQLAAAHGQVAMTFGSGPAIYFARSKDSGETFDAPVKVAEVGALALGRHRGPRLAILKDALVISAIAGDKAAAGPHAHGLPDSGNLAVWRSIDRGKTWKRVATVNDVPSAAREGLHAMAARPDGSLFATWLDLRDEGTRLYGAMSTDGGLTWSKNTLVYASPGGTICQCCHPTLAVDSQGRIHVMWRNVVDGARDLYLATSSDGIRFEEARKLGNGTWKLNACPMDGGGVSVSDGKVTSAWRRESNIYLAEQGRDEKDLGPGKDVALVKTAKGTYAAWTKEGGISMLPPKASQPTEIGPGGAFVNLVALPDGSALAAWETKTSIETRRVKP